MPFKGKNIQICRDPRFNVDLYFTSLGAKVSKVTFDKNQCLSWNNLLPHLKVDKTQDALSAWNDILPYLYIREGKSFSHAPQNNFISYPFNCFKGLDHVYRFSKGGDGEVFLIDGWSLPEIDGVWSNNYQANLKLLGLPSGLAVRLAIQIQGSINEREQQQNVDIYVNDVYVDSWLLDRYSKLYDLYIPAAVVSLKDPAILSFRNPERSNNLSPCSQLYQWKISYIFVKLSPLVE